MVENRPHHAQTTEGRTRPQEHQQHIWCRTDHITHTLRAEQGHKSISSTYGAEQTTSHTGLRAEQGHKSINSTYGGEQTTSCTER